MPIKKATRNLIKNEEVNLRQPSPALTQIRVGAWRDAKAGPMQVISGPLGRERVHFEAPEAARIKQEMKAFLA